MNGTDHIDLANITDALVGPNELPMETHGFEDDGLDSGTESSSDTWTKPARRARLGDPHAYPKMVSLLADCIYTRDETICIFCWLHYVRTGNRRPPSEEYYPLLRTDFYTSRDESSEDKSVVGESLGDEAVVGESSEDESLVGEPSQDGIVPRRLVGRYSSKHNSERLRPRYVMRSKQSWYRALQPRQRERVTSSPWLINSHLESSTFQTASPAST